MSDLIEFLAEGSHVGWMNEKQKQGFADHTYRAAYGGLPACCSLPVETHHTDMLPYGDLPEHIKKYDRVTVRGVLKGLVEYLQGELA